MSIAKGCNNTVYHKKVPDYASSTVMITWTFMVLYFLDFFEYLRARSLYFLNFYGNILFEFYWVFKGA